MPTERGKDTKGAFFKWGSSGKKYYYRASSKRSRDLARQKANRQGRAIKASGY